MGACIRDVRFTLSSGHSQRQRLRPLSATSGHRAPDEKLRGVLTLRLVPLRGAGHSADVAEGPLGAVRPQMKPLWQIAQAGGVGHKGHDVRECCCRGKARPARPAVKK